MKRAFTASTPSNLIGQEPVVWVGKALVLAAALVWVVPLAWMLVASVRPGGHGAVGVASLALDFWPTFANFTEAWDLGNFPLYAVNTTLIAGGILLAQLVTITMAGFAFARLEFPGRQIVFRLFLLQLMLVPVVLIVPNLSTVAALGLYDTLPGVMAPYVASAFGTFLMRQTFASIPRELEDAALIDGAAWWQRLWSIYLPLSRPALTAFAIVSVTTHWNEFLWPLMVINSPDRRPLTVGLAVFALSAEGTQAWGVIAAGTLLTIAPLLLAFVVFQRFFINSFMSSGIK